MPEAADVHVDGSAVSRHGWGVSCGVAAGRRGIAAPDVVDESRAAEHRRGMHGEERQQLVYAASATATLGMLARGGTARESETGAA